MRAFANQNYAVPFVYRYLPGIKSVRDLVGAKAFAHLTMSISLNTGTCSWFEYDPPFYTVAAFRTSTWPAGPIDPLVP